MVARGQPMPYNSVSNTPPNMQQPGNVRFAALFLLLLDWRRYEMIRRKGSNDTGRR